MRRTFVVGRIDPKTTELRLIRDGDAPVRGPFRISALTRPTPKRPRANG